MINFQKNAWISAIIRSQSPIERPNDVIQKKLFDKNRYSMPQVEFVTLARALNIPEIDTELDTSYKNVSGKGKIEIPNSKFFYIGDDMYGNGF